jgi:predicted PurR-regulated permease PerM
MIESRYGLMLAGLALLLALTYLLAPVITPFAVAALLAYLGDPLVDRVEKINWFSWKPGRGLAVATVFSVIFFLLAATLLLLIPLLLEQMKHLLIRVPQWFSWLVDTAVPWVQVKLGLEALEFSPETLKESLSAYWKEVSSALMGILGTVSAGSQTMLNWLMNLVLIPVVTFYLLRDWDSLLEGIRTLVPTGLEPRVSQISREVDEVLGAFIRGQMLVMLALGVVYTAGLFLIGLDLAFIIGMGAGLLSIVPYLGTFVGLAAALIAATFQFQDFFHPLMVLLVFSAGQSLEGMVLTPKLVGDKVGLHPVAVIFAVLAGGHLFGFLGILLALPVASALNVLVRHIHIRYRQSDLFESQIMSEERSELQVLSESESRGEQPLAEPDENEIDEVV